MIDALFTANPSDHHPVGALLVWISRTGVDFNLSTVALPLLG